MYCVVFIIIFWSPHAHLKEYKMKYRVSKKNKQTKQNKTKKKTPTCNNNEGGNKR